YFASRPPAPEQPEAPPPTAEEAEQTQVDQIVGKPAPELNIPAKYWANTNDEPITLEQLKGEVVLLEFWRATCPHCKDASPFITSLSEKYGAQGLRVIGIHSPGSNPDPNFIENKWDDVKNLLKEW